MIAVAQTDDGRWVATCSHCRWKFSQPIHTKTRHDCRETGERYVYVPADWESRSRAEKNPALAGRISGHLVDDEPTKAKSPPAHRRRCKHLGPPTGEQWPPKDGAGDYLERGLTAIGVTKDRWATAVASFTGAEKTEGAGCGGCEGRQKKINHVGEWLGIGKKSAEVRRLLDLEEGKGFPTFACAVHGTCLTTAAAKGIAAAPHSCAGCEERELVEIALPPAPPRSSDEATGA